MYSVVSTDDPRPWTGTATRDDIKPGVIIQRHNPISTLPPKQPYVVLTAPDDKGNFRYVTAEKVQQLTTEQLLEGRLPRGFVCYGNLYELGIDEINGSWMLTIYFTVEGEHPGFRE